MAWIIPAIGVVAIATVWTLAALIARQEGAKEANRALALLLFVEGVFLVHVPMLFWPEAAWAQAVGSASFAFAAGVVPWLYLKVLAPLDTPFAARLRSDRMRRATTVVPLVVGLLLVALQVGYSAGLLPEEANIVVAPVLLFYVLVLAFALVCAVVAFRRAEPASIARDRARAFVLAFGLRDVLFILAIASSFLVAPEDSRLGATGAEIPPLLASVAAVLYGALLAYGILRTQLFDIDLKVKLGLKRGTLAAVFVVAVFIAFQITQQYLNRNVGIVASGVVTGLLLFLSPRLNKFADKVADKAMPQVQATPVYVQFKKLEVYRAAVESAQETGGIGPRERASLDRLRDKLGLLPVDCASVEAEVSVPGLAPQAAPA